MGSVHRRRGTLPPETGEGTGPKDGEGPRGGQDAAPASAPAAVHGSGAASEAGPAAGFAGGGDAGPGHGHREGGGVVVVMGVAGTGKTTVGALLAEALGVPYAEADAFHPPANVAKMTAGEPLDDTDRVPWLDAIGAWAAERAESGGVVSCSALKRAYRDRLRAAAPRLFFVHLAGDRALIARRMEERRDHFMPLTLLDSQFATLEPLQPDEAGAAVSVRADPEAVTREALASLPERIAGPEPATGPERTAVPEPVAGAAPGSGTGRALGSEGEPAVRS